MENQGSHDNDVAYDVGQLYIPMCDGNRKPFAFRCIAIADGNEELTESLHAKMKRWADNHSSKLQCLFTSIGKEKIFEMFYGLKLLTVITIHPPDGVKTKGSGKRLKSTYERELEKAKKPKRRCKKCGRMVRHDSHNCGKVIEEDNGEE